MDDLRLKRIDVFTTNPFCGNPAGVVTGADSLHADQMQMIATEMKMNLIELAFISSASVSGSGYRVRFFTPNKELDMSGHVALAACYALIDEDMLTLNNGLTRTVLETRMGPIPFDIYFNKFPDDNGAVDGMMLLKSGSNAGGALEKILIRQPVYTFESTAIPIGEIASVLGIEESEIVTTGLPVVTASNEVDWLIIPVRSKETIIRMHPDLIKLGMMNRKYGIMSNHVFTLDTFDPACVTYSRNFSPAMGLWEDPASASASAGLGAYLREFSITASDSLVMQQGNEMDSLARILVEIEKGGGSGFSVKVGGLAVKSIERKLEVSRQAGV